MPPSMVFLGWPILKPCRPPPVYKRFNKKIRVFSSFDPHSAHPGPAQGHTRLKCKITLKEFRIGKCPPWASERAIATSFASSDAAAFSCSLTSLARGNGGAYDGTTREACRHARGEDMIRLEGRKERKVALVDLGNVWRGRRGFKGLGFHVGHLQLRCQEIFE